MGMCVYYCPMVVIGIFTKESWRLFMSVGDLVMSIYPQIYSFGVGIILIKYRRYRGPMSYTIYWSVSNKITRCDGDALEVIHECG